MFIHYLYDDNADDSSNSDSSIIKQRSIKSKSTTRPPTTDHHFDELPSEDSCLDDSDDDSVQDESTGKHGGAPVSSSSSCASSSSDDDGDDSSPEGHDDDDNDNEDEERKPNGSYGTLEAEETASLAHQLDARRNRGIVRKVGASTKKSDALALARKRLRDLKEKNAKKKEKDAGRGGTATKSFFVEEESDGESSSSDAETRTENGRHPPKKKKSKHRPTTASSLRADHFLRGAPNLNASGVGIEVGANRYRARDPRSEASHLSTTTVNDTDVFERRYEFLEEIRDGEIETLKDKCRAWKLRGTKGQKKRRRLGLTEGGGTAEGDAEELERLVRERAEGREDRLKRGARRSVNKKMKDDVASGKSGAYYLKKRDRKRMEMEAKFEKLKESGGDDAINKVLAKKRKKKRSKDASLMPRDMLFST